MTGQLIDVSFARSRLAGGFLGDNASFVSGAVDKLVADQKARLGRFLTYQKLMLDLKDRAQAIQKFDSVRGASFISRINSALANQSRLESDGFSILNAANNIKASPIIQLVTNKTVNYSLVSADVATRADALLSQLNDLLKNSVALNSDISDHEGTVTRIEKDIISAEGDLAQRGFIRKAVSAGSETMNKLVKYGAIAGVVVGVIYFLPNLTRKKQ